MITKISKYKAYIRISFLYVGASLIASIIGILINPILAKNLSANDYAIIGFFSSFQMLLTPLIGFNLTTYYLRNFSRIPEENRKLVSDTIIIGQAIIGLLSFVLFTAALYYYCFLTDIKYPFFPYAIYCFAQTYVSIFISFYLIKLRLNKEAKKFALLIVVNSLVTTFLTLFLVVTYQQGAEGKFLSALIAAIIMAVYSVSKSIGKYQFDFQILKNALKFGLPLTISGIFWYFLTGFDKLLLTKLNDNHTYGVYIVAVQISAYMAIFYTTINSVIEPDIYQAIAENKKSRLLKLMGIVILGVIVANFIFIIFAPTAIGLLTANRYLESTSFSRILAIQNITMAGYYMVVQLFIGYGYVKAELAVRVVGAIFSVLLFKIFINYYGFYGAAWGQVFSFLMLSIIGIIVLFFLKKKNINY